MTKILSTIFILTTLTSNAAMAQEYGSWNFILGCNASYRVSEPEKNNHDGKYYSNYEIMNEHFGENTIKFIIKPIASHQESKGQWAFYKKNDTHKGYLGFNSSSTLVIHCDN